MPRKIPWLTTENGKNASPRSETREPGNAQRARRKLDAGSDDLEGVIPHRSSPYKKLKTKHGRSSRTPSSSPPPEPPPEEFMRPGYRHDDLYRMVEDEFYTVAQKFTSHLHFAEYKRLKKETKQKSFETILSMRRPVDGTTSLSTESKRKRQAKEQERKAGQALKEMTAKIKGVGDEDTGVHDEEEPWMGTSLQGLMLGARRKPTALVGLEGVRSDTKASKGFGSPRKTRNLKGLIQSPTNEAESSHHRQQSRQHDDDDSDELGATGTRAAHPPSDAPSLFHPKKAISNGTSHATGPSAIFQRFSSTSHTNQTKSNHPPARNNTRYALLLDEDDDNLNFVASSTNSKNPYDRNENSNVRTEKSVSSSTSSISVRRAAKASGLEKEKGKGKARLDDIPLFLG